MILLCRRFENRDEFGVYITVPQHDRLFGGFFIVAIESSLQLSDSPSMHSRARRSEEERAESSSASSSRSPILFPLQPSRRNPRLRVNIIEPIRMLATICMLCQLTPHEDQCEVSQSVLPNLVTSKRETSSIRVPHMVPRHLGLPLLRLRSLQFSYSVTKLTAQ